MDCQCNRIGGPFIGADPMCPTHGIDGTHLIDERLALLQAAFDAFRADTTAQIKQLKQSVSSLMAKHPSAWD